ncbi:hypothetical protein M440DRAFT_1470524 [Trichoderma longibrachiatum ATCC 18648]|uniref:Zincin n=1 Tax=Trichoderma longibrachiatum ATCC 18648 TaxID=983965 RepID=A0A2T4C1Q7_TRILO|nr:hypothetical protein M440DRAFT_1470524 [Trichoderma longibrachiatum ATCC 18648]
MARSFFFFVQLCTLLALTLGTSSMPADRPRGNHTYISPRGKNAKNTVFFICQAPEFEDELLEAFEDAERIVLNLWHSLDKLMEMFVPDGSGALLPNKKYMRDRTFDEQNVLMTYNNLFMATALTRFNNGQPTIGTPNLLISCSEDEWLFEKRLDGRNWTDVYPHETNPTRNAPQHRLTYMLARECAPHSEWAGTREFIGMDGLCREHDHQEIRYMGSLAIKTGDDWSAYLSHPYDDAFDEVLTFCPMNRQKYMNFHRQNLDNALDATLLNVPWGGNPTDYQREAFETMVYDRLDLSWVGKHLVSTVIHELSHSVAFTPPGRALECKRGENRGMDTSHALNCLWAVAGGRDGVDENGFAQGHRDAEIFSMLAMALWINSATWWRDLHARKRVLDPRLM